MIKYLKKDITTVTHGIIVHGVNCLGVMGSGVALAIRNKWPKVFTEYKQFHTTFSRPNKELLGMVQVIDVSESDYLFVANGFTQVNCGNDGKVYANIDAVEEVLGNVFAFADHYQIPIHLPKIGCGLGGLNWDDVSIILEDLAEDHDDLSVFVYEI